MKKKKQKGAWKRPVASVLGMVLVIGLTIVGTLAFMYTKSDTKSNVFTGTNDIKLYLEEPEYNLNEIKDADGNVTYVVKDTTKLDPREYVPGEEYSKDPTLYNTTGLQYKKYDDTNNTTELAEEWVAMKVEYSLNGNATNHDGLTNNNEPTKDANGVITAKGGIIEEIEFDEEILNTDKTVKEEGNWIRIPSSSISSSTVNYDIFVYKYKLEAVDVFTKTEIDANAAISVSALETFLDKQPESKAITDDTDKTGNGVRTTPLFSKIVIKDQEQLKENGYDIANLEKFEIKLTGAAIKVMPTNDLTEISQADVLETVASGGTKKTSRIIVDDLVSLLNN